MTPSDVANLTLVPEAMWRERQRAHESRVRAWTDPRQARAARGEKHPVWDFLTEYYSFRPSWLRRWHPGPDLVLAGEGARSFLRWPEYIEIEDGVMVSPEGHRGGPAKLQRRREFAAWLRALLSAMQERPAFFGCHGMHEWAMVYRQPEDERRHRRWPLRLSAGEIERAVEVAPLQCTHFDAFRFFTDSARPLNRWQPTRESVPEREQRGCLHANMDLYKWAFKLAPYTPSELLADCFALAWDIREIDMRASPYDFRALGFEPIPVEAPAGRAEYERHQRIFATRAEPLRSALIRLCDRIAL